MASELPDYALFLFSNAFLEWHKRDEHHICKEDKLIPVKTFLRFFWTVSRLPNYNVEFTKDGIHFPKDHRAFPKNRRGSLHVVDPYGSRDYILR